MDSDESLLRDYPTPAADSTTGQTETSESDYSPTQRRGGHTTSDMDGYDSDDEIIPRPRVMRLTAYEIIIINLPWFGLSLMYLLLTVEVVPAQVEAMVGTKIKGTMLGVMVAIGALLTLVISPCIGLKSDRLTTRIGQRRPVIICSSLLLCIGLMGMSVSSGKVKLQGNNTEYLCDVNLTQRRCLSYRKAADSFHLRGPHSSFNAKSGASQTESVGFPIIRSLTSSRINGYTGAYVGCYLFAILAYAGIAVPYNALIADRTHPAQRGLSSGIMGGMVLLGNIAGACLGLFVADLGLYATYGVISGTVLLCMTITLIAISERQQSHDHEELNCKKYLQAFLEPFLDPNFRWLFFTRFMMQQGVSTIFTFIEYWVSDMVQIPNCWSKEKAVAILLIPLVFSAAICSVVFGFLSDRVKRRKPLVIAAAILMSLAAALLAAIRGGKYSYYITLSLIFISGIGYGTYLSVDFALLLDILPTHHNKAKDIAVWNQALILPQVIATPLGGFILDFFEQFNCELGLGYIIIFSITALYFLVSGLFVIKIDIR